jgi:hypothetical protein
MKQIATYIGYVMGILGFAGIIWTYASKSADKQYEVADVKKQLTELQQNMITKNDIANVVDSIVVVRLKPIMNAQNALRTSYVQFVKDVYTNKGKSLTFDDFVKYMDGIEFELKTPRVDTMDFQIKIRKKQ